MCFDFTREFDDSTLAKQHIIVGHFVRSDTSHVMQAIDVTRHSRITQQPVPSTTALSFVCCSEFACKKKLLMTFGTTLVSTRLSKSCVSFLSIYTVKYSQLLQNLQGDHHIHKMAPLGHNLNLRLSQRSDRLTRDSTVHNKLSSSGKGLSVLDATLELHKHHSCQFCISEVPLSTLTPCRPRMPSAHKALPVPQAVLPSPLPAGHAAGEPAPQQPVSAATVAPAAHVTAEVHDVCSVVSQHLALAHRLFSVGHSVASYMSHHHSADRKTYITVI